MYQDILKQSLPDPHTPNSCFRNRKVQWWKPGWAGNRGKLGRQWNLSNMDTFVTKQTFWLLKHL